MVHTVIIGGAVDECDPIPHALTVSEAWAFIGMLSGIGLTMWLIDGNTSGLIGTAVVAAAIFAANHGDEGD